MLGTDPDRARVGDRERGGDRELTEKRETKDLRQWRRRGRDSPEHRAHTAGPAGADDCFPSSPQLSWPDPKSL